MAVAVLLSGCSNSTDTETFRADLAQLRGKVDSLSTVIAGMRAMQAREFMERINRNHEVVTFDPAADEGFSRLDTSVGSFTVSVQNVQPYADGIRVVLHIGNLTSAQVTGAKLNVKWGTRIQLGDGDPSEGYDAWRGTLREKSIDILKPLKPGYWNVVTIALPNTRPEEFGYLAVAMETNTISLSVDS